MNRLVSKASQTILRAPNHSACFKPKNLAACRSLSVSSTSNQEFRDSEDLAKERYDMRANEEIEKKRARLLYQSRKRGMLENGVILASFADKYLDKFNPEQLDIYDRLINLPTNDWDIFHWATNTKPTPPEFETTVMKELRDHIKSKVSNRAHEKSNDTKAHPDTEMRQVEVSVLGKTRPDDVVLPPAKDKYDLDIDPSQVDIVNYEEDLFDNRTKRFINGEYVVNMTEWRKSFFLKRMRRTLPSPVSLRNLSNEKQTQVFSQRSKDEKNIANEAIVQTNPMDTPADRMLKHHDFLQHLLQSEFTNDVLDYDDETEAWSEMMWRRDYGFADARIAPSNVNCTSCRAQLHCCEPGLEGYVPKEIFASIVSDSPSNALCQRCKFSQTYNASLGSEVSEETYKDMLHEIRMAEPSIICVLVDLTDFPSGLYTNLNGLVGTQHRILIVGNKLDLLPHDGPHMLRRVLYSFRNNLSKLRTDSKNLLIHDVMLLSARTGFGVESLVTRLLALSERPKNIYLLGSSNSGKSTLFSALLQSDLSAIRQGDLLSRISIFKSIDSTEINLLKFPIEQPEGWEVELKKRKMERVERDEAARENSLLGCIKHRQANTIHTTNLIDRFEYHSLPSGISSSTDLSLVEIENEGVQLKFTADHPLTIHKDKFSRTPLSATKEEFPGHAFFHQTPSFATKDQLHNLLTTEERLEVFPNETIVPRTYSLRPLQTIFIAGLARLDLLTSNASVIVTVFVSKYLPIHVIPTRKADKFYYTFLGSSYLGVPFGSIDRLRDWPQLESSNKNFHVRGYNDHQGDKDIVFSSVGWAAINVPIDQECIVKAYTPEGRGISSRSPPLLSFGHNQRGKKIRDTPLFTHKLYSCENAAV